MPLENNLARIEELVQHGSVTEARNLLREISSRKVPRAAALKFANLSRRAHMPWRSVLVLYKIVRPAKDATLQAPATPDEKAEYAAALNAIGATHESLQILSELDGRKLPVTYLFESYIHLWAWDWDAAIPLLRKYTAHPEVSDEMRMWGRVFLGNSLTHGPEEFGESERLLGEVIARTSPERFRMLHKNALLNLMQNQVRSRQYEPAARTFAEMERHYFDDPDPIFILVAEQWNALLGVAGGRSESGVASGKRALKGIREAFLADKNWENVRGCDFYLATSTSDRKLLEHLYYGTPYAAMRARLLQALGREERLADFHEWRLAPVEGKAASASVALDVTTGRNSASAAYLKKGQLLQKTLQALASDFYKPLQVAGIDELVYPDQVFHPVYSPDRIHQLLKRLRAWFAESGIPLVIRESLGFYWLQAEGGGCRLTVPRDSGIASEFKAPLGARVEAALSRLKRRFGDTRFSAREASELLGISVRSAIYYLNDARDHGRAERHVNGPRTQYSLK